MSEIKLPNIFPPTMTVSQSCNLFWFWFSFSLLLYYCTVVLYTTSTVVFSRPYVLSTRGECSPLIPRLSFLLSSSSFSSSFLPFSPFLFHPFPLPVSKKGKNTTWLPCQNVLLSKAAARNRSWVDLESLALVWWQKFCPLPLLLPFSCSLHTAPKTRTKIQFHKLNCYIFVFFFKKIIFISIKFNYLWWMQ